MPLSNGVLTSCHHGQPLPSNTNTPGLSNFNHFHEPALWQTMWALAYRKPINTLKYAGSSTKPARCLERLPKNNRESQAIHLQRNTSNSPLWSETCPHPILAPDVFLLNYLGKTQVAEFKTPLSIGDKACPIPNSAYEARRHRGKDDVAVKRTSQIVQTAPQWPVLPIAPPNPSTPRRVH